MDEHGLLIPSMTTISLCESHAEEEHLEYAETVEIINGGARRDEAVESVLARGEVTPLKRSRGGKELRSAAETAEQAHKSAGNTMWSDKGKYSAPRTPPEAREDKGCEIGMASRRGGTKMLFEQELRELMILTQQSKRR